MQGLGIHIRNHQMEYIEPTEDDIWNGRIISDAGVKDSILKIVAKKIDMIGYIQGRCVRMADLEIMKRAGN